MKYLEGISGDKRISRIGLGTWQFGSKEWGYGDDYDTTVTDQIVARAAEVGITLFDTAEIYGFGRSERILGAALERAGVRDDAFIATKIFPVLPVGPVVGQRARASAERLGVRCIDLYQVHQPNPLVSDSLIMPRMRDLQDDAHGRRGRASATTRLQRWKKAEQALGRPSSPTRCSSASPTPTPWPTWCPTPRRTTGVIIAYSPLAQGLLSAKYDAEHQPSGAIRRMNPLFAEENLTRAAGLLDTLREVAGAHDVTAAQVALSWLIHHPGVVVIPGASGVGQVEANAAAAEIVLADDEVAELSAQARAFAPRSIPAVSLGQAKEQIGAAVGGLRDRLPFG